MNSVFKTPVTLDNFKAKCKTLSKGVERSALMVHELTLFARDRFENHGDTSLYTYLINTMVGNPSLRTSQYKAYLEAQNLVVAKDNNNKRNYVVRKSKAPGVCFAPLDVRWDQYAPEDGGDEVVFTDAVQVLNNTIARLERALTADAKRPVADIERASARVALEQLATVAHDLQDHIALAKLERAVGE